MGLKITKDNTKAFLRNVNNLSGRRVLIGIPDQNFGSGDRENISKAEIGYVLETGSPEQNIPPRPVLVPGVASIRDKAMARMKTGAKAALNGDMAAADKALSAVGFMGVAAVKEKFNSNVPPPLAESTLEERRRRGVTRTNTLVDTGELRDAIKFVLIKGAD